MSVQPLDGHDPHQPNRPRHMPGGHGLLRKSFQGDLLPANGASCCCGWLFIITARGLEIDTLPQYPPAVMMQVQDKAFIDDICEGEHVVQVSLEHTFVHFKFQTLALDLSGFKTSTKLRHECRWKTLRSATWSRKASSLQSTTSAGLSIGNLIDRNMT